jgi:hypothetical protein
MDSVAVRKLRLRQQRAAKQAGRNVCVMFKAVAALRKWAARPAVKYPLIAVVTVLWLIGLADQIPDPAQTAKYVGLSILIAAVASV